MITYGNIRSMITRAGAIALLALVAASCSPPPPPPPPPVPEAPPKPVYTQAKFEKILYGMTYGQVADIMGEESTRQESTYDEGESEYVQPTLTAWHYWENEDGSFVKVGFIDKQVTSMESENLPQ